MFCQAKSMKTPEVHLKSQMFSPSYTERRMYQSLPNPYGWNKSWKLRKLDYHSPAVDQKRRQTTWIEVHQWHLKPEASNTMKKPLLVTVPAFQSFLDRSPQQNDRLWRARNIVQTRLLCPTRLRVVLNQLLSESPPSAVKTQAAWFNFQRPLWP